MRKSDGFTLVELLVGILCTAIVTGAAMTLMLMGARTNRALLDANSEQNTARIITAMVDKLASEGSIKTVVTVGDHGWALLDEDGATILSYSDTTIYSTGNTVLMENVTESKVTLSNEGTTITGRLLDFSLTANEGTYETSVFCRTADMGDKTIDGDKLEETTPGPDVDEDVSISMSATEENGRFTFLQTLCEQYGSTGEIKGSNPENYFSQWYLQKTYGYNSYDSYNQAFLSESADYYKWGKGTPWCACFVSWGIDQIESTYLSAEGFPEFAHVEKGIDQFESRGLWKDNSYLPAAGDLIFFNYSTPAYETYSPSDADHVGVVFYCDGSYVYTIEGNTSIDATNVGRVDLKRYPLNDTDIIGYGILNWK